MSNKPIALIPARGGSVRIPRKNMKMLAGHPLVAYTIRAAIDSGVFGLVVVSTDDDLIASIAMEYGVFNVFKETPYEERENPTDFDWIKEMHGQGLIDSDVFAILRPTTPFRKPETIRAMWKKFLNAPPLNSMRSMVVSESHPYKMWWLYGSMKGEAVPFDDYSNKTESYNKPTQKLWEVYKQNSSMEFCLTGNLKHGSWSGSTVFPFLMDEYEGHDINTELDWHIAEMMIDKGLATLPDMGG